MSSVEGQQSASNIEDQKHSHKNERNNVIVEENSNSRDDDSGSNIGGRRALHGNPGMNNNQQTQPRDREHKDEDADKTQEAQAQISDTKTNKTSTDPPANHEDSFEEEEVDNAEGQQGPSIQNYIQGQQGASIQINDQPHEHQRPPDEEPGASADSFSDDDDDGKTESDKESKTSEPYDLQAWNDNRLLVIAVLAILVAIGLALSFSILRDNKATPISVITPEILQTEVFRLKKQFNNQNAEMWDVVEGTLQEFEDDTESRKPAVLLIASFKDSALTARCIGEKVADMASKLSQGAPFRVDISEVNADEPKKTKHQLDQSLRRGFESGSSVAIVNDLHLLSAEAAILLHGYADNENAPFKKAVIVFTCEIASLNDDFRHNEEIDSRLWDQLVNEHFKSIWQGYLGESKAQALVSRVAMNAVIVNPEHKETISKICGY